MSKGKILYIRSGPYELNFDNYNLQEVGLGKAFCALGYDFDILYYTKKDTRIQELGVPENRLRILWTHGIKMLRSGIYPSILKKDFLKQYSAVIVSEYSQIMSVLVARRHSNTFVYNGPYYNLFKIPAMEPVYDALYASFLNRKTMKVFCKTQMAVDYIAKKDISNSLVVGVGLDPDKFEAETKVEQETQNLLDRMAGRNNLLYVGQIIPRKNTELLIKAFIAAREKIRECQLVLVGSGDADYKKKCEDIIPDELKESVIWCPFIKNAQLKFIYEAATAFLLPSAQEIFGMVLLEAMYFGLPVISSHSAGADTLIKSEANGIIIDSFSSESWSEAIIRIMNDEEFRTILGEAASKTIREEFMWGSIAQKMIDVIEK